MELWPTDLMTPEHVHGATSPEHYRMIQRQTIAEARRLRPALRWRDPWVSLDTPAAFVSGGKWVVRCACGNAPSVHPAWGLALCLECGAIYEHVRVPVEADQIAAALSKRASAKHRHWFPPETVADLEAETVAHGEG